MQHPPSRYTDIFTSCTSPQQWTEENNHALSTYLHCKNINNKTNNHSFLFFKSYSLCVHIMQSMIHTHASSHLQCRFHGVCPHLHVLGTSTRRGNGDTKTHTYSIHTSSLSVVLRNHRLKHYIPQHVYCYGGGGVAVGARSHHEDNSHLAALLDTAVGTNLPRTASK